MKNSKFKMFSNFIYFLSLNLIIALALQSRSGKAKASPTTTKDWPKGQNVLHSEGVLCIIPWKSSQMGSDCDQYLSGPEDNRNRNVKYVVRPLPAVGWHHMVLTLDLDLDVDGTSFNSKSAEAGKVNIEKVAIQAFSPGTNRFVGQFSDRFPCRDEWEERHKQSVTPRSEIYNCHIPNHAIGNFQPSSKKDEIAQLFTKTVSQKGEPNGPEFHIDFFIGHTDREIIKEGNEGFYFLSTLVLTIFLKPKPSNNGFIGNMLNLGASVPDKEIKLCLLDQRSDLFKPALSSPPWNTAPKLGSTGECTVLCHEKEYKLLPALSNNWKPEFQLLPNQLDKRDPDPPKPNSPIKLPSGEGKKVDPNSLDCPNKDLQNQQLGKRLGVGTGGKDDNVILPWTPGKEKESLMCQLPWTEKEMEAVCDRYYQDSKGFNPSPLVNYEVKFLPLPAEGWVHVAVRVNLPKSLGVTGSVIIERIAIQAISVPSHVFVGQFSDSIDCDAVEHIKTPPTAPQKGFYCEKNSKLTKQGHLFTMENMEAPNEIHLNFEMVRTDEDNKFFQKNEEGFYFVSFLSVRAKIPDKGNEEKICLMDQKSGTGFEFPAYADWPELNKIFDKRTPPGCGLLQCHWYKKIDIGESLLDSSFLDPRKIKRASSSESSVVPPYELKKMHEKTNKLVPCDCPERPSKENQNPFDNYDRDYPDCDDAHLKARATTPTTPKTTPTTTTPPPPPKKVKTEKTKHINGPIPITPIIKDPNAIIPIIKPVKKDDYGGGPEEDVDGGGGGPPNHDIKVDGLSVKEIYKGCDDKKTCTGDPETCVKTQSCQSLITFGEDDRRVRFQIMGKAGKYVAVGLSRDFHMGDDSVVECVREYGTQVNAYVSYNYARNINKRETDHSAISGVKGSYVDGYITCEFWRRMVTKYQNNIFDLANEKFHLLHARGNSAKEGFTGNVGYHDESSTCSKGKHQLNEKFDKFHIRKHLEKLHSIQMIATWLFCFPVAAFIARYYKETYMNRDLRGCTIWYSWHVILGSIGSIMTVLSILCATLGKVWLVGQGRHGWNYHNKSGIAIMALVFVEVSTGFLISFLNTRAKCQIANYIHGFVGHSSFFVALACMYNTTTFDNGLPCSGAPLLITWLVLYFIIHLLMSYQVCYVDFVRGYDVSRAYNIFHVRAITHPPDEDVTGSPVRKIFLCIFTCICMMFTLMVIIGYLFTDECNDAKPV